MSGKCFKTNSTSSLSRKPMYEDRHESCSVLMGRVRNSYALWTLDAEAQFTWFHRFYLVVDRVVEEHKVYKLYGGPTGFLISANVAEPDEDHATTLYRFIRHLMSSLKHVTLPGGLPADLVLVAASGAMASGLLGTTSLTYQLVGQAAVEVTELAMSEPELNLMVTSEFFNKLEGGVAAASNLRSCGTFKLSNGKSQVELLAPSQELDEGKRLHCPPEHKQQTEVPQLLPESVLSYRRDPLLRYEDEAAEDMFVLHRGGLITQDAVWSLLGFMLCMVYLVVGPPFEGRPMRMWQVSQLCLIPGVMMWLRHKNPEFYLRQREHVWVLHRVVLVLVLSLSDFSWAAAYSGSPTSLPALLVAYGTGPVLMDVLGRRLRFHMQLISSLIVHVITMLLMGIQDRGRGLQNQPRPFPLFLSLHFLLTVLLPCLYSFAWDTWWRKVFEAKQLAGASKKED